MSGSLRKRNQQKWSVKSGGGDEQSAGSAGKSSSVASRGLSSPLLLLVFHITVACMVAHFYHRLPTPVTDTSSNLEIFSEARARAHIETFVGMGVRTVGSHANEVVAPQYIVDFAERVKSEAVGNTEVEVDVQHVAKGAYYLDFLSGFTNVYQDITNVVVRVSARDDPESKDTALLVSAHYDSAIGSPAASDDASSIGIMMEMVSVMAHSPPPVHAVIFNFNGAEEAILEGAHGFIMGHKWKHTIKAFVNLEAAGAGGRELLFQTGPKNSWLAHAYAASAPYPHGTVVAQDTFQSGVIPSDTDFRIYRDYGNLPGIDLAFMTNGFVYHTTLDDGRDINAGSVQRCGDNVLATVQTLASSAHLTNPGELRDATVVYYDFLGLRMIVYSYAVGIVMHTMAAITVVLVATRAGLWAVLPGLAGRVLASILAAALGGAVSGALLIVAGKSMSWYGTPWVALLAFVPPAALAVHIVHWRRDSHGDTFVCPSPADRYRASAEVSLGTAVLWGGVTLLMSSCGLGSAYLPALAATASLLVYVLMVRCRTRGARTEGILPVVGTVSACAALVPALLWGQVAYTLVDFFLPLMGRAGSDLPSDIVIGALLGLITGISMTLLGGVVLLDANRKRTAVLLAVASVLGIVVAATVGETYTASHPKRLYTQHVRQRTFPLGTIDSESAKPSQVNNSLWVNPFDYSHMDFLRALPKLHGAKPMPKGDVYDGLPWFLPIREILPYGEYVPASAWSLDGKLAPLAVNVVSSTYDNVANVRTISLHITGPDHMGLALDPNVDLVAWSLDTERPPWSAVGHTEYVWFASGKQHSEWDLWVKVKGNDSFGLSVWAHYLETSSTDIDELDAQLPPFVDAIHFLSDFQAWTV